MSTNTDNDYLLEHRVENFKEDLHDCFYEDKPSIHFMRRRLWKQCVRDVYKKHKDKDPRLIKTALETMQAIDEGLI